MNKSDSAKSLRTILVLNLLFFLMIFVSAGKINAAGSLDQTFGAGGLAFARVGTTSIGAEMEIQTDGKIVVAGYTGNGTNADFAVARFNPNGTLDTSFNGDGKVVTPLGTGQDNAYTVAIQPDGKIIAAGGARGTTRDDFALVRYNPNGSLDNSFDGDGKVITPIGDGDDVIFAIAIQPDGKILVVGFAEPVLNLGRYFAVARYNPDGSLDTAFDGDGKVTTFFRSTPNYDVAHKIVLQPDGKILVAGSSFPGLNQDFDFALARYNPNGSLDTSFDGDGKLTTQVSVANADDFAYCITLQPDGKIVAAGNSSNGASNEDCAVVRYNPNGSLDSSFDGDGKVYISFGDYLEILWDVAIQPDGKIALAGSRSTPPGSPTFREITMGRLNPNGSLDTTFDSDGKVITPLTSGSASTMSMRIMPNGKIIAAGYYAGSVDEFMLVRYMGDVNTVDFDGDTKTDLSIFRPSNGQWWLQNSSNNSGLVLTFGTATDKIVPGDYTGDGKSDVAFWQPSTGQWFILRSENFSFYAFSLGNSTDVPAPADYDGDGRTDAAVFRPLTATWYINKSSGGTDIIQFGTNGDKPVASDYDGDGKADLAIYRPGGGTAQWWIRRSSNGSVFAAIFGTATDKPVPGDYTGDGKSDIAFFNPNGSWFVLRSEDSSFYAFQFGQNGDLPVPGDYDGDGKYDAAVFRPSNSTWFVQRSTAGTLIQTFGTAGDLPVPNSFVP